MKNTPKGKAKPQPVAISQPAPQDWLSDPPTIDYSLVCYCEEAGDDLERLNMNRAEWLALRVHLARLRGVEVDAETERDLMEDAA
jgi:hypothetical protein